MSEKTQAGQQRGAPQSQNNKNGGLTSAEQQKSKSRLAGLAPGENIKEKQVGHVSTIFSFQTRDIFVDHELGACKCTLYVTLNSFKLQISFTDTVTVTACVLG